MTTKESFLASIRRDRIEAVRYDAGHGARTVGVRVLTLAQLDPVVKRQNALPAGSIKSAAILLAATLCDEDANPLFDIAKDEDIEEICNFPHPVVRLLSDAAARVNGLSGDAAKDAEKN
jgi:hypothetical protein